MTSQHQYDWKVFGQDELLSRIERDIDSRAFPHALLLVGPDMVGKFTILKRLAQILQCDGDIDANKTTAKEIAEGRHLDTFIYEDNDNSLKIEEVRSIRSNMSLSSQSKYKIVVIQNVERMTIPAANALLKVLEEPPEGVIFLLSTNDITAVLDTVISRCRVYRAKSANVENMRKYLNQEFPDIGDYYVSRASEFSAGHVGKAISLIEDQELFEMFNGWFQELTQFEKRADISDLMAYAEKISELDKHYLDEFFWLFFHYVRHSILSADDSSKRLKYSQIANLSQKMYNFMHQNVNKRLALEVLFLQSFANFSTV